jgi:hypothetical protein
MVALGFGLVVVCASAQESEETEERIRIAAANMEDAIVVDCQLPGKLRRLGGSRNYLTPGRLIRASAIVCRTRGGEYTLGDLASGTLSLQRWMVPAKDGDAEAQYYVARIYANGMDNVDINYAEAASWYQMAADQGYAEAKQELGYLYERGLGVEQDTLKALNLQREASGLGDALDYSYKIDDANALAASLATQLNAANNALADSQLELMDTQARLTAARSNARQQDLQIVALVADLEEAKRVADNASSPRIAELEGELANVSAQLEQSQTAILELERERASGNSALAMQMAGGQATQMELRELLGRTEAAEQDVDSLTVQLAEAQNRLILSNKEVRDLQLAFREQSDEVAAQRARILEARSRSDSDAAAYIAGQEAELASRAARISGLEAQLGSLQTQLASSQSTAVADGLRQELAALQARYDNNVAALQQDQGQLRKNYSAGKKELAALYAESKQHLAERDGELNARKREIDVLALESARLRTRVEQLESQQSAQTQQSQSDLSNARMQASLAMARQKAVNLRSALEDAHTEKSALESELLRDQLELQAQLDAANTASESELELLRAQVAAAESTINLQDLRITTLEKQAAEGVASLAALKTEAGDTETIAIEMPAALSALRMAQSAEEDPNLGRFHALLIANEAYVNMPQLTTPIRDVRDIEKLLVDRYGFEVQILTDATDDMIMRALHDYSNNLTDQDNLLVYYAGRGSTPDGPPDRAYWLGVDADPELRNTWLLSEHISDKIKQIDAQRILVVTDSCFSRRRVQPKSAALGRGVDPNIFRQMASLKSRVVLTSGANVPVNDENGDRTHSLFAKYFMEILRQNENVLSGEMLSYELGSRVREKVENPERVTPSYTSLQDAGHRGGDFFFVPVQRPLMVAQVSDGKDSV